MNNTSDRLVLYGAPASQPSRAVVWTCLLKGLSFELRLPDFARMRESDSELTRLNPKSQIPTIVDGDFVLYEMPAILVYLCEKHGWEDLYPPNLEARALVNQYLHFHHGSTRMATMKLMAPHVTVAFRELIENRTGVLKDMQNEALAVALAEPDVLDAGRQIVGSIAGMIESGYLRGDSSFLCGNAATIADIACYEELAQLRWAGLFEFEGFPKIQRWLEEMTKLSCHEQVHRFNTALGDILIAPNTIERFLAASKIGQSALEELGARVT